MSNHVWLPRVGGHVMLACEERGVEHEGACAVGHECEQDKQQPRGEEDSNAHDEGAEQRGGGGTDGCWATLA